MNESSGCLDRPRHGHDRRQMQSTDVAGQQPESVDIDLPADMLHDDEIILLLLRPSPLFIILFSLGGIVAVFLATVAVLFASRFVWLPLNEVQIVTLGTGLLAARLGWQLLEWYSRLYILTDRRIIRRVGVLRTMTFESPLSNIQHTEVFARLRERLFGLGTIGFATSGTGRFEAFWVAVRQPYVVQRTVIEAIERYGRRR